MPNKVKAAVERLADAASTYEGQSSSITRLKEWGNSERQVKYYLNGKEFSDHTTPDTKDIRVFNKAIEAVGGNPNMAAAMGRMIGILAQDLTIPAMKALAATNRDIMFLPTESRLDLYYEQSSPNTLCLEAHSKGYYQHIHSGTFLAAKANYINIDDLPAQEALQLKKDFGGAAVLTSTTVEMKAIHDDRMGQVKCEYVSHSVANKWQRIMTNISDKIQTLATKVIEETALLLEQRHHTLQEAYPNTLSSKARNLTSLSELLTTLSKQETDEDVLTRIVLAHDITKQAQDILHTLKEEATWLDDQEAAWPNIPQEPATIQTTVPQDDRAALKPNDDAPSCTTPAFSA